MGVYINMEMPKEGFAEILIRDDGTVQKTGQSYRIDGTDYYTPYVGEMPVMYKAVSVPEPHGDLIDADALTETTDGIWDCNDLYFQPNDKICDPNDCKGCKWRETMDCFRRRVKHAPTVIPASEEAE